MEIEKLKAIMSQFDVSSASSLKVKMGDMEIELEKPQAGQVMMPMTMMQTQEQMMMSPQYNNVSASIDVVEQVSNYEKVVSPLVGIYYASKDEASVPYVEIGKQVKAGDTVFLVEAMKVFNEIKSPVTGIVKSINCVSGEAVEFDQVILEIDVNV